MAMPLASMDMGQIALAVRWRHRLLAALGVAAAWLWPKMAYARVAKRRERVAPLGLAEIKIRSCG